MNVEASFQMFACAYQAGQVGPHWAKCVLRRNNIFFNALSWWCLEIFLGWGGGEAGVFSAPLPHWRLWNEVSNAIWKAVENAHADKKYQKTACCSLISTSQDSWESTFFTLVLLSQKVFASVAAQCRKRILLIQASILKRGRL